MIFVAAFELFLPSEPGFGDVLAASMVGPCVPVVGFLPMCLVQAVLPIVVFGFPKIVRVAL